MLGTVVCDALMRHCLSDELNALMLYVIQCRHTFIVMIWCPKVPVGDAAPQALRGLRGGWRSPRRRLRAHGPGRAGVGLHPELQNRVRLLPVAQPQTYPSPTRVT